MKIINDAWIKDYTTYKLVGKIKKIIFPESIDELKEVLSDLKDKEYKVIGKGSNLIISESYKGTFINLKFFDSLSFDDNFVTVGAGYSLSKLSRVCAGKGLSGLEFACGIPGSIGGAIYMNAGAYGKEIKDAVKCVTVIDADLNVVKLYRNDLEYGYRDSVFKRKDFTIVDVTFELEYGDADEMRAKIKEIMALRREKQPLEYPSAGSVFRNPDGYSAGRLVEKLGLKGCKVGDAEVSLKHGNFIVNKGNASAEDVIKLISVIKAKVKENYGIDMEEEQEIIKG